MQNFLAKTNPTAPAPKVFLGRLTHPVFEIFPETVATVASVGFQAPSQYQHHHPARSPCPAFRAPIPIRLNLLRRPRKPRFLRLFVSLSRLPSSAAVVTRLFYKCARISIVWKSTVTVFQVPLNPNQPEPARPFDFAVDGCGATDMVIAVVRAHEPRFDICGSD